MQTDFLIIGGGIIGLCLAKNLRKKYPAKKIVIIDKENHLAYHASGRNSGVLHAGFYYAADSLKAKFTLEGNRAWKKFCHEKNLPLNENGKVVVATQASEIAGLQTLYERGQQNGVPLQLIDAKTLSEIEPNAKTCEVALYSPETATVSPTAIIEALKEELLAAGIEIYTNEAFISQLSEGEIKTSQRVWQAEKVINAAGMYADVVAKQYGLAQKYVMMPFKGLYLKYHGAHPPLKVNVYPVPDLNFPFLGVHFTVDVSGQVKIGPTAIAAFWRENYKGLSRFNWQEGWQIFQQQVKLFWHNKFNFRAHALNEMKKFYKPYFVKQAKKLVHRMDGEGFDEWTRPGIRAQLLNVETQQLVQDFVIEADKRSVHILNAVSPAFTCALPFSAWVVEKYL